MIRTQAMLLALAMSAAVAPTAWAQAQPAADYAQEEAWLCRPGRQDACAADQTATIVPASGRLTREAWRADPDARADCFYVYPTVSADAGANSDLVAGPEERRAAAQEFARFGAICRPFAPVYRQVIRDGGDAELAYGDVRDAWRRYLAEDNRGRPVVLIGHAQGAEMLKRLLREEIEGAPAHKRLVSALLLGVNVLTPRGKDVGGDFKSTPLCRDDDQTRCVVAFVAAPDAAAPPARAEVRTTGADLRTACVNPAAPYGGRAALVSYFAATSRLGEAWAAERRIETPFVKVPGRITGHCVAGPAGDYLAITLQPPRQAADAGLTGAAVDAAGRVGGRAEGLDVAAVQGDLIRLVAAQAAEFGAGDEEAGEE